MNDTIIASENSLRVPRTTGPGRRLRTRPLQRSRTQRQTRMEIRRQAIGEYPGPSQKKSCCQRWWSKNIDT